MENKSSAEPVKNRVKKCEDAKRAKGLKGRKKWATEEEHILIDKFLNELRSK